MLLGFSYLALLTSIEPGNSGSYDFEPCIRCEGQHETQGDCTYHLSPCA